MSTDPMWKIQTIVTGVAGSPYYLVGYFDTVVGTPQNAVAAWAGFTHPSSATSAPTGATYTTGAEVLVVDPVSGDAISSVQTTPVTISGSGNITLLPPATQGLARWRTGIRAGGREIRGRTNLPLLSSGFDTGRGIPTTTYQASINTRIADLIANAQAQHVVWSKTNGVQYPSTSGSCWSQWAVLRSRRD